MKLKLMLGLAGLLMTGIISRVEAQSDFVPPLSGSPLAQWQVQGEYFGAITGGGNLGAWLIANGNNSYTVVFLPGGLLSLPDQPYGGWVQTGWNRSTFSGTATLTGTTFTINSASNYKATAINGTGEAREMVGVTPTGAAFTLKRVVRNSPTHSLRPKSEWGAATLLFDSATGQADLAKWTNQDNAPQLSRKFLYRGSKAVAGHGAGLLHIEFQGCFNPTASGQGRSNSGVYLQGHYEAQVLDSFGNSGAHDEFGAIYTVKAPSINAALPPLTWHTYDIYFTPRTSGAGGDATGAATMTIYANGVKTVESTPVLGVTTAGLGGSLLIPAPLYLQNHGNEVVYNNIWFIPNATEASLPFATLLQGTVGLKDNSIQPLLTNKAVEALDLKGRFDLNGREIRLGKTLLKITPNTITLKKDK
jgi:hypothetical protein